MNKEFNTLKNRVKNTQKMNIPACHQNSHQHSDWIKRVQELENEGLDTSDAQAIADMEFDKNLFQKEH